MIDTSSVIAPCQKVNQNFVYDSLKKTMKVNKLSHSYPKMIKACSLQEAHKSNANLVASCLQDSCYTYHEVCEQVTNKIFRGDEVRKYPLYNIIDWDNIFDEIPIKINTFAFKSEGNSLNYYRMPCARLAGYGRDFNENALGDRSDIPFDFLMFPKGKQKISFVENKDIFRLKKNAYLTGVLLVKEGIHLDNHPVYTKARNGNDLRRIYQCTSIKARSGIMEDWHGNISSFIIPFDNKEDGATCHSLAQFLITIYDIKNVFLFDGGGSVNLSVRSQNKILYRTSAIQSLRPIPHFLGIKNEEKDSIHIDSNF